ncbi:acyltransferase family protein [Acinetobacter sp. c2-A9]|uniref:acyltransferase family protein n=1 Tax=Acinetobacter sp. c2-A9 TaxID=3342802 RepID=UPI0035B6ECD3
MQFRYDINALRAIAVLAVLIFHFNSDWLPGGFIGVDVFFVISGYLMTGIIVSKLATQQFKLTDFYLARAYRIIPALLVLCTILLVLGYFFLLPMDYKAVGRHVASSLSFVSNINYLEEIDYFDVTAKEKFLLHTWSLSVEWQFYLIYPIIILILHRIFKLEHLKYIVLLLFIVGFSFCIYSSQHEPMEAFYLLYSRAWEMLVGGVAYLFSFKIVEKQQSVVQKVSILLILFSYFFFDEATIWPSYWTIIPVFGAFLFIVSNCQSKLLNYTVIQAIGRWSYSIYLWHWVFAVIIFYYTLPEYTVYVGILLSILCGFLSYRYIESINLKKMVQNSLFKKMLLILVFFIIFLSAKRVGDYKLIQPNISPKINQVLSYWGERNPYHCMPNGKKLSEVCYIGNKDNIRAIMVGDSHTDALLTGLVANTNVQKQGIAAMLQVSCPMIAGANFTGFDNICALENQQRSSYLAQNLKGVPVIWTSRLSAYLLGSQSNLLYVHDNKPLIYFEQKYHKSNDALLSQLEINLKQTICSLSQNHPVYMVLPVPELPYDAPKTMAKRILLKQDAEIEMSYQQYLNRNQPFREMIGRVASQCQATVLDPAQYLCDGVKCKGSNNGTPWYYDDDHLNQYGNQQLQEMFSKIK